MTDYFIFLLENKSTKLKLFLKISLNLLGNVPKPRMFLLILTLLTLEREHVISKNTVMVAQVTSVKYLFQYQPLDLQVQVLWKLA